MHSIKTIGAMAGKVWHFVSLTQKNVFVWP